MCETARELVAAGRSLGLNSHLVDIRPSGDDKGCRPPDWWEDRRVAVAPTAWLSAACTPEHRAKSCHTPAVKAPKMTDGGVGDRR
jgi:hypothetical protein